jgi:hypothetical protein
MHIVITLLGLGVAIALLAPLVALRAADPARRRAARRHLAYVGGIVLVCAAPQIGITFAPHALNVAAVLAALGAAAVLVPYAVTVAPRRLAVPVALLCTAAWLATLFVAALSALFDGSSPLVSLGDGMVCRDRMYGTAATDSGVDYEIHRRYLFIDRLLFTWNDSDQHPEALHAVEARWQRPLARCQAMLGAALEAAQKPAVSPGAPAPP